MSKSDSAASFVEAICNDDSHGYEWGGNGPVNFDCSGLMNAAYIAAGVPVNAEVRNTTMTMPTYYPRHGFKDVIGQVNLATGAGLRRGDVLGNRESHCAMFLGNGKLGQARSNLDGVSGDSSGQEVRIQNYYNFPWNYVLRYQEGDSSSGSGISTTPTTPSTPTVSAPASGADADGYYTVRAGDSLWAIAQRELGSGARYREIMAENGMTSTVLHVGDLLKIPGKGPEQTSEAPATTTTPSTPTETQTGEAAKPETPSADAGVYVVQKGDTLWGIAHRFLGSGLRWREIQKANGLKTIIIHVGDRLKIPEK